MKSISPYQLWKFVAYGPDNPLVIGDEQRQYADYRLSQMLLAHNIQLKRVTIIQSIETMKNLNDIHYLRAHIFMIDESGEEMIMDIKPRYLGDDGEWALLMGNLRVDDIDIRFKLDSNKLEPTWIAVHMGEKKIPLDGDVMDWDLIHRLDDERDRSMFYDEQEFSPRELDDMKAEVYDPDYSVEDSNSANYYWWM